MKKRFSRMCASSALLCFIFLAGCGGGGGGGGNASKSQAPVGISETSMPVTEVAVETSAPVTEVADEVSAPVTESPSPTVSVDPGRDMSSTIAWLPPTENMDASTFTDLTGYKIYIGSELGRFEMVRALEEPGLTEYVLEDLPDGTYYVAMTSVNSQNIESPLSNVVVKVVGDDG